MKKSTAKPEWPLIQSTLETIPVRTKHLNRFDQLSGKIHIIVKPKSIFSPGIYIFVYHSIIDNTKATEWEKVYRKGVVYRDRFESQIELFSRTMHPVRLSEVPEIANKKQIDQPYFVITFDDAYSNILSNAAPVIKRYGIHPAVFVNGLFAEGIVYYRILAALLIKKGFSIPLAEELRRSTDKQDWSMNGELLFVQTKDLYVPEIMEQTVEAVYRKCIGEPESLGVHLDKNVIRELRSTGYEIGNHTYDHRILGKISFSDIDTTIMKNKKYWEDNGVCLVDWIAYPNGASKDVGQDLFKWFNEHPNYQGVFCNGGVNLVRSQTEWLRLFPGNVGNIYVKQKIEAEFVRTCTALKSMSIYP